MSNDQEKPSNWGGSRPGAGNKYKWKSGETKAIRIPIAIADEVLKAAQAIDEGKSPLINDCVTQSSAEESNELTNRKAELEQVKAYNSKLSKEVSELETKLFKASQQLQQVTKERNEYFDRIADIQLELDNLKDDRVTQSNPRDSKETTNAVRQWCVFARHNDGKLQFMGGYWSKGDAEARMHKARREHHRSESIGDKPYIGPPPTFEVRETLVAPVGLYNHSPSCTTEIEAKVVELEKSLAMLSELHRESDLRRQELESLVDDYQTKRKYEAEESDRIQQPRILGIDLEEFYDAVMLGHPPRERKLIGKPLSRFKALIKEALTRRGVPVR
jgi:regulator of replication initiation timing